MTLIVFVVCTLLVAAWILWIFTKMIGRLIGRIPVLSQPVNMKTIFTVRKAKEEQQHRFMTKLEEIPPMVTDEEIEILNIPTFLRARPDVKQNLNKVLCGKAKSLSRLEARVTKGKKTSPKRGQVLAALEAAVLVRKPGSVAAPVDEAIPSVEEPTVVEIKTAEAKRPVHRKQNPLEGKKHIAIQEVSMKGAEASLILPEGSPSAMPS